jgi:hypothetical protein
MQDVFPGAIEMANFFMDDTKWYDVTIIFLEMLDCKT